MPNTQQVRLNSSIQKCINSLMENYITPSTQNLLTDSPTYTTNLITPPPANEVSPTAKHGGSKEFVPNHLSSKSTPQHCRKNWLIEDMTNHQINKARQSDRKKQLEPKDKSTKTNKVIAITYNKNHPNLKKAIDNNWHILSINPEIAPTFQQKPILAFRRNPNLGQLLFKHKLRNNMPIVKKVKK